MVTVEEEGGGGGKWVGGWFGGGGVVWVREDGLVEVQVRFTGKVAGGFFFWCGGC